MVGLFRLPCALQRVLRASCRHGLLLVLAMLLAGCAYDAGGLVASRADQIAADPVSCPISGYCASSCTMRLIRDCVHPTAHLVFHMPSTDTPHWRAVMARHYPAPIAAWFMTLPHGTGAYAMTGSEAEGLGAQGC